MGPQRRTALTRTDTAGFSEITYGGHNHTVQWNATLSPYWLVEASFARAYNNIEETPSVNEWFVTNRLVTPNVRSGGIGFYEVGNEGETLQYQLKSTNIVNFFGNHQFRYGVSYEDIDYSNTIDCTGPSFTRPDGVMTFEGFFRNDNGQSDPAITSLFDFPTNDPSYTAIGVPAYGFRGDIRFLGELGAGPLPNDRTHQAKVFGSYLFPFGLNVGVGATASSGQPLTALAANPAYRSAGEIPETPRGAGFETVDGFRDHAPAEVQFDVHLDFAIPIYGQRLTLVADVFNLFDRQEALEYDNYSESTFGVLNPDFGRTPRQVRIGARLAF